MAGVVVIVAIQTRHARDAVAAYARRRLCNNGRAAH
jgi:hypothetical protein